MNSAQAKEILILYRPGTADERDAAFAEALQACRRDPELKAWFERHCAVYHALRDRFRQIAVPEGLREQILAERKAHTGSFWNRPLTLNSRQAVRAALFAAVLLVISLAVWLPLRGPQSFYVFNQDMRARSLYPYGMELTTNDVSQIRDYLALKNATADFELTEGLRQNALVAGCVAAEWKGKKVSMICFQTGRPLAAGQETDLWLFVIGQSAVWNEPKAAQPQIRTENDVATATWTADGKTYLLVVRGDEQLLRRFL